MRSTYGVRIALGLTLCASLAAGCAKSEPAAPGPDVWATVDGQSIARDRVEKTYRGNLDPAAGQPSEDEATALKLNVLEELINQEILIARAGALNLAPTDAEVDSALADRKRGVAEEAFQEHLKSRSLTTDDFRDGIRRELTVQKLMEREITSKIVVSDDDISAFYNQNRAQFNLAEPQYRVAQIIITPARDPQLRNRMNDDAGSPVEAKRKSDMLLERLRGGADFAELAMDYSEDPRTVGQGGDLGFIPQSALAQVPPQLREIVMKTNPGGVSAVTIGEIHSLVLVASKEPAGQRDLTMPSVRDSIRDGLRERKDRLLRTAYVTSARNDAKVTNILARQVVDNHNKTAVPPLPTK